jgi:hypothetical protein
MRTKTPLLEKTFIAIIGVAGRFVRDRRKISLRFAA